MRKYKEILNETISELYEDKMKIENILKDEELDKKLTRISIEISRGEVKYSKKCILQLAKGNNLLSFFIRKYLAKNPLKQAPHESACATLLNELSKESGLAISNIQRPPSLVLFDNIIIKNNKLSTEQKIYATKTIDGEFICYDKHIYLWHKYTKEDGGIQKNTLKEVQDTIIKAVNVIKNSEYKDIIFLFACDGPYLEGHFPELNYLNSISSDRIIICKSDDIEENLKRYFADKISK